MKNTKKKLKGQSRVVKYSFTSILISIVLLVSVGVVDAENIRKEQNTKTVKILTIGNSFADNACHYLKGITESVDGCNIVIGKANIGGCYLGKHAGLIEQCEQDSTLKPYAGKSLKELLQQEDWDVVTIQQVSSLSFKSESYQPYVDQICDFVKKHEPEAQIYIHETWAYAPDCNRLEGFGITAKQMHRKLKRNYYALSRHYDFPVLLSGDAFYSAVRKKKDLDLWDAKDRFHANSNGCYLAGCVWCGELFDLAPEQISYVPEGMSEETAKYLRKIAAK